MTRRTFLRATGSAAATTLAGGALAACGGSDRFRSTVPPRYPIESLTEADFCTLVGEQLALSHPVHGAGMVTLDACDDLSATYAPGPGQRNPFRLGWTGGGGLVLEDGLYTVEHPVRGPLELFVFGTGGGGTFDIHFN